ncbi:hypothetical protein ACEVAW_004453 [Salmonella enterica]|nr:hypothetical protein [Salmonella enterica]EJW4219517.1 hypothetical protein [Salmonella enterica subsp. enterica serovar Infantis]EKH1873413.1 hypothetical protein [Salmonella enterica subsp. enterica serovar Infantis]EKH5689131.1 hypothetical protein [Salmonella enterica]EKS3359967.1 hypothetical protein [Salmonella enterica]
MDIKEALITAIKQNRGDILYDYFMFQTLEVKLNAIIYLIRVLKEDEQGNHFINIMIQLIAKPEYLNTVVDTLTPLQEAVIQDKLSFFNFLLMNGASLEKRNKQGLSGYDLILKIGNDRFLDFIIKYENVLTEVYKSRRYK